MGFVARPANVVSTPGLQRALHTVRATPRSRLPTLMNPSREIGLGNVRCRRKGRSASGAIDKTGPVRPRS